MITIKYEPSFHSSFFSLHHFQIFFCLGLAVSAYDDLEVAEGHHHKYGGVPVHAAPAPVH